MIKKIIHLLVVCPAYVCCCINVCPINTKPLWLNRCSFTSVDAHSNAIKKIMLSIIQWSRTSLTIFSMVSWNDMFGKQSKVLKLTTCNKNKQINDNSNIIMKDNIKVFVWPRANNLKTRPAEDVFPCERGRFREAKNTIRYTPHRSAHLNNSQRPSRKVRRPGGGGMRGGQFPPSKRDLDNNNQ